MNTNYAVPPGLYLRELLDENQVNRETLLDSLGISDGELNDFLAGNLELSESLADKLAEITPIPADAWMQLEEFYRSELDRISTMHPNQGHPRL